MELTYSEQDEKFRGELGRWLKSAVTEHGPPPSEDDWPARREYDTQWQRCLYDAGFAGINWPGEYGGRDASLTEQLVYHEEYARAKAPYVGVNFVGLLHGGPTLIAEGSEDQKRRHLSSILRGSEVWSQGFSEPGAGSDLASLRTKAVREGDEYIVTGQKIWSTYAQVSDFNELLVRTDPDAPKHRGISWLILPMDSKGIEIRPLRTINGESEFSEIFLDEVRVPVSNRVGKENDGWRVTNVTLRFERGTAFAGEMYQLQQYLRDLIKIAKRVTRHDAKAWDDATLRRDVGHAWAELEALWAMVKMSVSEAQKTGMPGIAGSAIKLYYTELNQRITELGMRLLGRAVLGRQEIEGLPADILVDKGIRSLSLTIAAGSSQIQRNIIAERILGLPKDR
jgi:alkylation response protein AidB-like acyl-CoA dehydrogenase